MRFKFLVLFLLFLGCLHADDTMMLRANMDKARPGDYFVITAGGTDTLMHFYAKKDQIATIEEIAVPEDRAPQTSWKEWVAQNAPKNTSWVMYDIDLNSGQMLSYYSFTKGGWYDIPEADNFLSKLLNLNLTKIPDEARKRIGPKKSLGKDLRPLWQPRMVVEGQTIPNVPFDAWRTRWPRDSTELSGKTIEVYLPQASTGFPAYFPYWLQISGLVGKAQVRIIDSGTNLHSPKPMPK